MQPMTVTRCPLGVFRGLTFGLILYPGFAPEAYLEGSTTQQSPLASESRGPRAIMNAVERLAGGYGARVEKAAEELSLVTRQLRDYELRVGAKFSAEEYWRELLILRDQLRDALIREPARSEVAAPASSEAAQKIQQLMRTQASSHTSRQGEHSPARDAAKPVTTQIIRSAGRDSTEERIQATPSADVSEATICQQDLSESAFRPR